MYYNYIESIVESIFVLVLLSVYYRNFIIVAEASVKHAWLSMFPPTSTKSMHTSSSD